MNNGPIIAAHRVERDEFHEAVSDAFGVDVVGVAVLESGDYELLEAQDE